MRKHVALVSVGILLGSCGGSGGGPPSPTPVVATLFSSQEGSVEAVGNNFVGGLVCGDNNANPSGGGPYRAFLTFSLSLPSGAAVTSAVLHLRQANVAGNPYTDLGTVLVEHVDYGASAPFKTNFAQAALDATGGTLSANSTLEDKALDVTASVQADLAAARTRSQFRLRFTPLDGNADGQDDLATFENATNDQGTTEVPRLVVTYTP